ncbi:Hypothetical predicted protein, partial [Paramuricea clavata]
IEEACRSKLPPQSFSVVFDLTKPSEIVKITPHCPPDAIYDTTLKFCREGYHIPSSGKLTIEFIILLWFKPSRGGPVLDPKLEKNLIGVNNWC